MDGDADKGSWGKASGRGGKRTKEEVCPYIKTDEVRFEESESITTNKILVQSISIKALRIFLTFRL